MEYENTKQQLVKLVDALEELTKRLDAYNREGEFNVDTIEGICDACVDCRDAADDILDNYEGEDVTISSDDMVYLDGEKLGWLIWYGSAPQGWARNILAGW